MYVVLAWFAERSLSDEEKRAARTRFEEAASAVVPETYLRHEFGGEDWGVTVRHCADQGAYRWPVVAAEGPVSAVSLGLPVGLDVTGGPVGLARRLLAGEDVHRQVVPPFGVVALDAGGRFAVQQDWLGMCRLFVGEAEGVTALCSRPSLLATFLRGRVDPDLEGWASYTTTGHFGGDLSPVRGVRMLRPGERLTGSRRAGGGWEMTAQSRYAVDDVVMAGIQAQGRPLEEPLALAAEGLTSTAASIYNLYDDEIDLGLSGGKDSRLIAASIIAAGRLPRFVTNEDTRAEGEVARELVQILRDRRGLDPDHKLVLAGAPATVLDVGLHERVQRLQRLYDYQFASTYTVRPASPAQLPEVPRPASLTGAGGELAIGVWYPREDADDRPAIERAAFARMLSAMPLSSATDPVVAQSRDHVTRLLAHATSIGVTDLYLLDYLFLAERLRRKCSSAYTVGMVTPFLAPAFVSASFALAPEHKRDRVMHIMLLQRLMPEWGGVRYVSVSTGPSTASRVWEGDGTQTIANLVDTAHGPITQLMRRSAVEKALVRCVHGPGVPNQKILQQFAWLAVASEQLEPGTGRPVTSATYNRIVTAPKPRKPLLPPQLQWIKKTRLGRRLRSARSRLTRRGGA